MLEIFERIMRDAAGAPEYHYVLIDYVCRVDGRDAAARATTSARWNGCAGAIWPSCAITEGTLAVIEKAFRERRKYR